MKALILDGSKKNDDTLTLIRDSAVNELKNIGWIVDSLILRDVNIAPCNGHFCCWFKTPGECIIDDTARDITRAMIQSELLLFLTPITFGGYSPHLKKALDRIIPIMLPYFMEKIKGDTHHSPRYERYPNLVAIGTLPNIDYESEHIFRCLVARNAINLYNPNHVCAVVFNEEKEDGIVEKIRISLSKVKAMR